MIRKASRTVVSGLTEVILLPLCERISATFFMCQVLDEQSIVFSNLRIFFHYLHEVMRRTLTICFLACCWALASRAQYDKYRFSRLDISHGLSNNEVTCIFKDHRGFLWFGTMSGLNRWDGYTFKIFRNDLRDS